MLCTMDTMTWTYWRAALRMGLVGGRRTDIQNEITRARSMPLQEGETASDRPHWEWPHVQPGRDWQAEKMQFIRTQSELAEWNGKAIWKHGKRDSSQP